MATHASGEDPLFMERLEVFLQKGLDDLRDFARRERRDFEYIRLKAAEWHSKYLFDPKSSVSSGSATDSKAKAHEILQEISHLLESLLTVSGHHSFFLVVNPLDDKDDGFLGGTVVGREYWRGLRNGGAVGARNFKEHCMRSLDVISSSSVSSRPESGGSGLKQTPAVVMKNNLYVEMRTRLRAASGVRNAEMKWTKPGKLSTYGVALVGWPPRIEYKNPSKMTFQETSTIMRLLQEKTIYFVSLQEQGGTHTPRAFEDVSWAFNDDAFGTLNK